MTWPWVVAFVALASATVLSFLIQLGFLRRATVVLERAEAALGRASAASTGIAPGTVVPKFSVRDRAGRLIDSGELLATPGVYLFLESSCSPCRKLADDFEDGGDALDGVPLRVVLDDSPAAREFPLPAAVSVLYDSARTAWTAFQNAATPQAYAVGAGGLVTETVVPASLADLRKLAAALEEGGERRTTPAEAAA